jgi:methylmalonyl-CoA mutase N-terminal domain/subunit
MEADALALISEVDRLGGMVAAIEAGFPQRRISDSAYAFQRAVETGDRVVVGVNNNADEAPQLVPTLSIDARVTEQQIARTADVRTRRDARATARALMTLEDAARGSMNVMPVLVDCAAVYATIGEMTDVLRKVWGEYEEASAV